MVFVTAVASQGTHFNYKNIRKTKKKIHKETNYDNFLYSMVEKNLFN